jgi:hypothetical protein
MDRSREQLQLSRADSDEEDRLMHQIRQEATGKERGGEIFDQVCKINAKLAYLMHGEV